MHNFEMFRMSVPHFVALTYETFQSFPLPVPLTNVPNSAYEF